MDKQKNRMHMQQKIFELGLSVETVSIYLMCSGLADSETELTFENLASVWNGGETSLRKGLEELEQKRIITAVNEAEGECIIYNLLDSENWNV